MATGNYIPSFHAALADSSGNSALSFRNSYSSYIIFSETDSYEVPYEAGHNSIILYGVHSCKDITITPPKQEVESVNCLGQETTVCGTGIPASGSFQNTIFNEKACGEFKINTTLIIIGKNSDNGADEFIGFSNGIGKAVGPSGTYRRYTFGDSTAYQTRDTTGYLQLVLNNGSELMALVMVNPLFNLTELKPTGMDGYFEMSFEASCLAKNFAFDIKD